MIYFMRICNTGVLLLSNGKISCDLIRACSEDSQNTHELDTRMNFTIYVIIIKIKIKIIIIIIKIIIIIVLVSSI